MTSPTGPVALHNTPQRIYLDGRVNIGGLTVSRQCVGFIWFVGFGIILIGAFVTGFAYNDPFRDDDFFKKFPNPGRIIGPIFLGFGIFFIVVGTILCALFPRNRDQYLQQQSSRPPQVQPDVNIYMPPSTQGSSQPYPPQPAYQQMEDKVVLDAPPPYFVSSSHSAPPSEPMRSTQLAYNPSTYGTN